MLGLRAWFLRHPFASILLAMGAGRGFSCGKEGQNIGTEPVLSGAARDFGKIAWPFAVALHARRFRIESGGI